MAGGHERHQGEGLPCCPSLRPCGRADASGGKLTSIYGNLFGMPDGRVRSTLPYPG